MDNMQLIHFIHFFQFSKKILQNVPKKGQNSTLFTFGGQNMTLRNTSHKMKKIGPEAHISARLFGPVQQGLGFFGA